MTEVDESERKIYGPRAKYVSGSLNEINVNCLTHKDPDVAEEKSRDDDADVEDPRNFIIPIRKKFKIRIYKPLILLKLSLFIWYGAGSAVYAFIFIFFKQKGISVSEMAAIYLVLPFVQFLGPSISGIIADKIGSSKPVLIIILLLNAILIVGIVTAPDMNALNCDPHQVKLKCHLQESDHLMIKTNCGDSVNATEFTSCNTTCQEVIIEYCHGHNLICDLFKAHGSESNFSLVALMSSAYKVQDNCYYNITSLSRQNTIYSVCTSLPDTNCSIPCSVNPSDDCSTRDDERKGIVILNAILLILLLAVLSTTYRIMDVTAMSLVKEHNADFGRQRFFSMFGVFVFSTFSGWLATASATHEEDKNYKTGLYVFVFMIFVLFGVIYKLKVQIKPPGENMWKKSLSLLKKPDVIAFSVVLIVLGSACGFNLTFLYWYLEELGTSSFLLGLINGLSALYGLPFLFTSNWWVKTLGTGNIIILGLLGYVIQYTGYSFLYDPWLSVFIQATDILTYHLLWVAVVVHSHSLAPEGLTATVIATAGGIHFSLGLGAGSLIGGYVMDAFGGRKAFRAMAVACLTTAVFFAVYLHAKRISLRKCIS